MTAFELFLVAFATARLSRLLVSERGFLAVAVNFRKLFVREYEWDAPDGSKIVDKVPRSFMNGEIGKMLMCELCTQVVFAGLLFLPIAISRRIDAPLAFILWLAIAQGAGIARKFS